MAEYIETNLVLELVRGRIYKYRRQGVRDQLLYDTLRYLEKKIKSKPAADVAPVVHAMWVNPHWLGSTSAANCSACNFEAQHREYRGVEKFYKYCPGCNAIMDLEESK